MLVRVPLGRRQAVGGAFVALIAAAVTGVLLLSGRSLGDGVRFEVELRSPGALAADARIRLAGREVGEVRGLRRIDAGAGRDHVVAECFVARRWAEAVRANSELFVAMPSILGEAYLEIGAARGEPGPAVREGQRLRGADPPELDALLAHLYRNSIEILGLLREHRPEIDSFIAATDGLMATLSGLPVQKGQLARIRDEAARAADEVGALAAGLEATNAGTRLPAIARALGETADRVSPELADLSAKARRAADQAERLGKLVGPEQRAQVAEAMRSLASAADRGQAIARDVRLLAAAVERGEGTIGGFLADREIFEDLHETHRILKWQPWTFVAPVKPRQ